MHLVEIRVPENGRPRDEGQTANTSPALPRIPSITAPFPNAVTKPLSWLGSHKGGSDGDGEGMERAACYCDAVVAGTVGDWGAGVLFKSSFSDCKHFTDVGGAGKDTFISCKHQPHHLSLIEGSWRGVCWYLLIIIYNTSLGMSQQAACWGGAGVKWRPEGKKGGVRLENHSRETRKVQ